MDCIGVAFNTRIAKVPNVDFMRPMMEIGADLVMLNCAGLVDSTVPRLAY